MDSISSSSSAASSSDTSPISSLSPSRASSRTSLSSPTSLESSANLPSSSLSLSYASSILAREIGALQKLHNSLSDEESEQGKAFVDVVRRISSVGRGGMGAKVVCTGVGKSLIVARKAAGILCSFGVPSVTLHPTEAMHGDLGLLSSHDVLLLFSHSGTTRELLFFLPYIPPSIQKVLITSSPRSILAQNSDVVLTIPPEEADEEVPAPTASMLCMGALVDAIALTVLREREGADGAGRRKFGELHPGGRLGEVCRD
ncbi:SIS domain-containing protein [Atractiella rhizophila]|nr:SIS domain-containing protein [Atractiella rhizophila]